MTEIAPAPPSSPRWPELLRRHGPPAVAFALAWLLVALVVLKNGYALTAANFSKWDATLYQSIAQKGYEFFPCAGQSMWGGTSFCGNTGWFPLYPWLTRALALVVRDIPVAAILVTAASFYAVLWLVWNWLLGGALTIENGLLLALAAFFPGALYFVVPYPLTLFLLFVLLAFRSMEAERWLLAGVFGGLATLSYATGLVLVGVFGLHLLITGWHWSKPKLIRAIGLSCGLTLAGLAVFLVVLQLQVGHWDAFFQVQAKYGYGLHDPLGVFLEKIVAMFRGEYRGREEFQGFQHLVVSAWILGTLIVLTRNRDQPPSARERLCLIYGTAFWLFPMVVGSGALLWRAQALLLPTVALGRRLSVPVLTLLLCTAVLLSGELTLQYFKNWLP